jgi:hypothetical protein
MNFTIVNCPDKDFLPYIRRAAHFFADELIKNSRVSRNCFTKIKFTDRMRDYGVASVEEYNSRNEPREFLIEIHSGIGARRILETLAHELVHVKQYIEGETDDELSTWNGVNVCDEDYWSTPWEIDAYGREPGLITKFAINEALWEVFDDFRNPNRKITTGPIKWRKEY